MEQVHRTTVSKEDALSFNESKVMHKLAASQKPTTDTIVFCDEDGMCSCLNSLINFVASLFSSCLAVLQGLWSSAPETPVVSPEVAAVATFYKKWFSALGKVTPDRQPEWAQEYSALCDEARAAAMQTFVKSHHDYEKFLVEEDTQYIVSTCTSYASSFNPAGMDAESRANHLISYRENLAIERALCRCQGHPAVLVALNAWRKEQQQDT